MKIRELNKQDFEVGQEIALLHIGELGRKNNGYTMATITSIGVKYIYCGKIRIELKTGQDKSIYGASYELYFTEEEVIHVLRKEHLLRRLRILFNGYNDEKLTVEQLMQVADVLKIPYK